MRLIVKLTGQLSDVQEEAVIIERDGVAREVLVPPFAIPELTSHRGQSVTLHTIEFYEGAQGGGNLTPRMLGFLHTEDRSFFNRFVCVKGFGPRKAMKALIESVRQIATWIETNDTKALTRMPGVGKRGAEMIVATLKGKMEDLAFANGSTAPAEPVILSHAQRDALEVLVAWGDPRTDAERWLARAEQLHADPGSADEWVRLAYRVKTGVEG